MTLSILQIGTAQPALSMNQDAAAEIASTFMVCSPEQAWRLKALYRCTRIERRASVLLEQSPDSKLGQSFMPPAANDQDRGPSTETRMRRFAEDAPALAIAAARSAIDASADESSRITHLITVCCTGFNAPGFDIGLIRGLKLSPGVARTQIGFMGCHGALNALRVALAYSAARPQSRILICATELCSLHYQYGMGAKNGSDHLVANAIFADGAAAVLCGPTVADDQHVWRLAASGSQLFAESEDAMSWRIGDHGFEMTLSPEVPGLIGAHLRSWLESWLAENGSSLAEIQSWAIHPGGPRIIDSVASSLGLDHDATTVSRQVLAECGNMSSPTILFILKQLIERDAPRPCVAIAFGPGLCVEAALFR